MRTIDTEHPIEEKEPLFLQHTQVPAQSSDGFVFAITSQPAGSNWDDNWEIHLLDAAMIVTEKFPIPVGLPYSLNWSYDGEFIIFSGYKDAGYRDLFALDVGTGEVIQLTFMQQDEFAPALWP